MQIRLTLTGTSPLLMHNPRLANPDDPITRILKELTSKRKKTDADLEKIAHLEWTGGLYEEDGVIVQPSSKPRKCIINAGKITKLGKSMERALYFSELNVPLIYDGPKNLDELYADKRFVSKLSAVVGTSRVMRVRPQFPPPWQLTYHLMFIDDAGVNYDQFVRVAELAGIVEGIGDNRVNGYGRFTTKVEKLND